MPIHPDYYTLYINTQNPFTGTTPSPNNNVIVLSKNANNSICSYQIDYDALFKRNQDKYKKVYVRAVFQTENVNSHASNAVIPLTTSTRGVLSIIGIPTPNSNVSALVYPMNSVDAEYDPSIYANYASGTITGTVAAGGILTATAETGNVSVGDLILSGGAYYPVLAQSGTYGTRVFVVGGLPTNASSATYNAQKVYTQPQMRFEFNTLGEVPDEITLPTGVGNITVRASNYSFSLTTGTINNDGQIPVGKYMLKLVFECWKD